MSFKTYKVTCLECGGSDELKITADNQVFYTNHFPIIAARFRPDMNWGFECGDCHNDSRLAYEEKDKLNVLVRGAESTVKTIADGLKKGNESKFKMESV